MEEQIDGLGLGNATIAGKRQRVGAIEADLVAAADQRLEPGDNTGAPASSLLDLGHPAFKKPLVGDAHISLSDALGSLHILPSTGKCSTTSWQICPRQRSC
jgi:hypothetical protein